MPEPEADVGHVKDDARAMPFDCRRGQVLRPAAANGIEEITEMERIAAALEARQQVLVLLPEIALS